MSDLLPLIHQLQGGQGRAARVYNSSAQSIPHDTPTTLQFNSVRWDNDNMFSLDAPDRLTCRTPGVYMMQGHIEFDVNPNGVRYLSVWGNDYSPITFDTRGASGGADAMLVSTQWRLLAGDYVTLRAYQSSGGPLNIEYGHAWTPEFMMHWAGP